MSFHRWAMLLAMGLLAGLMAQETLDRVLVVVGDEIILESEVGQELQRWFVESGEDPAQYDEDKLTDLKFDLVQSMIDSKVIYEVAQEDTNIVINDRDIDAQVQTRMDEILRRVGSERKLEEVMGMPVRAIRGNLEDGMRERMYVEQAQQRRLMGIDVSRQEVEEFFHSFKDSIPDVGESVHLSHIFLEYKPSQASEDQARALADSVRQQIMLDSLSFSEAAMTFSQDQASAAGGGTIGRTKRGNLVRAYEETAYRMEVGSISEPVRSEYGWHVIRLDERQGEYIESSHILFVMEPTFDDRQEIYDLADSLYNALADSVEFAELARRFSDHNLTRQSGGDLGWLEMSQLEPLVRSRSRDLSPGEYCRPFRGKIEGKDGMQLIQVLEHRDARRPSLEEDWAQLTMIAQNYKKQQELKSWTGELRSKVFIHLVD